MVGEQWPRFAGRSTRREDHRLLTGRRQFVATADAGVGKVRLVGEAVAVVMAESRDHALDRANQRRSSLSRKSSKSLRGRRGAAAVLLAWLLAE